MTFGKKFAKRKGRFNKSKIASPEAVLALLGLIPKKVNRAGYFELCCPFHKGGKEKHPSLNVHSKDGNYKCHTCGKKGGDILAFYMEVTKENFVAAAKALDAWEYDI